MTSRDLEMSPSSTASSGHSTDGQDAWLDLVSEQLSSGLADDQRASLATLLADLPGGDFGTQVEDWERLAGDVALATAVEEYQPLPEHLRSELRTGALAMLGSEPLSAAGSFGKAGSSASGGVVPAPAAASRQRGDRSREAFAWMAAAAALLVAVIGWLPAWQTRPQLPPTVTVASQRAALLAEGGASLVQLAWAATDDEAVLNGDDLGDVVFDPATQEGYMRFRGLAANDPSQQQYQLWVFDAEQDERYPVDGGVFDVPAGSDEVIVPIHTAIAVQDPTLFAITVEKPGGVVVSSRERLPLLAKVADPT